MLTAAVLLLLLELGLRLLNLAGLVPDGSEERAAYRSLVAELEQRVPEVAVVGSSRARRGVLAPNLRGAIEQSNGVAVVKNFALQGAQAEEVELVVRRMAEVLPRPKLIVWPITPRDLEVRSERP